MEPLRDNPFDAENEITSGDPFNLQTKNLSDHILITWEYTYEAPAPENYRLYRVNSSGIDTLYTGTNKTYHDNTVEWDSTYSYYVAAIINNKETQQPELTELPEVIRRIYVGDGMGYTNIGDALEILNDGDVIYVKDGTYTETIDFKGKAITLISENGPENCILDGESTRRIITFESGEDENTIINGFTIKNGGGGHNKGGGIIIDESSPTIVNCIIEDNNASKFGGGIYLIHSSSLIDSCSIRNNNANNKGGGLYIRDAAPIIKNCTIEENYSNSNGSGIYYQNNEDTEMLIENCEINSNESELKGGGIYIDEGYPTVVLTTFINNSANEGGAIYVVGDDFQEEKKLHIQRCIFSNNIANLGGASFLQNKARCYFENCIITNNESNSSVLGGGGIFVDNSNLIIDHCTFSKNIAVKKGGALYIQSTSTNILVEINNSILWGNISGTDNNEIYSEFFDGVFNMNYNHLQKELTQIEIQKNNRNENPMFIEPNTDFHLQNDSPCIDSDDTDLNRGGFGGLYEDWDK